MVSLTFAVGGSLFTQARKAFWTELLYNNNFKQSPRSNQGSKITLTARSPSLGACNYPIFTDRSIFKGTCECCAAQHYEHKWWNRELTLKCKLKCYVKPMKDPLGVTEVKRMFSLPPVVPLFPLLGLTILKESHNMGLSHVWSWIIGRIDFAFSMIPRGIRWKRMC